MKKVFLLFAIASSFVACTSGAPTDSCAENCDTTKCVTVDSTKVVTTNDSAATVTADSLK